MKGWLSTERLESPRVVCWPPPLSSLHEWQPLATRVLLSLHAYSTKFSSHSARLSLAGVYMQRQMGMLPSMAMQNNASRAIFMMPLYVRYVKILYTLGVRTEP